AGIIVGYAPSGEVQIQLSSRPSIKRDQLDRLVAGAKKEMAADPQHILKVQLRPMGNAQILERQKVGQPGELTTFDKNNQPHTSIESNFSWTLDVLVPHDEGYQVYGLSFIALTKSQYDKDKDFLNGVLSTLAYSTGESTATTASSATQPAVAAPTLP